MGANPNQLAMWGTAADSLVRRLHAYTTCAGCQRPVPAHELRRSLWGQCRDCENKRIGAT